MVNVTDQIIKNNIILQKKTTELLISINTLTKKIDRMVGLFENAAKHIEKEGLEQPTLARLNELLEQNKKIAKGLLMLEKYVREKSAFTPALTR